MMLNRTGGETSSTPASGSGDDPQAAPSPRGATYLVKLRDPLTRSWGNEIEIVAASALDAAERVAGGERFVEGPGERANLRARVWKAPHGTSPDIPFYVPAATPG